MGVKPGTISEGIRDIGRPIDGRPGDTVDKPWGMSAGHPRDTVGDGGSVIILPILDEQQPQS